MSIKCRKKVLSTQHFDTLRFFGDYHSGESLLSGPQFLELQAAYSIIFWHIQEPIYMVLSMQSVFRFLSSAYTQTNEMHLKYNYRDNVAARHLGRSPKKCYGSESLLLTPLVSTLFH